MRNTPQKEPFSLECFLTDCILFPHYLKTNSVCVKEELHFIDKMIYSEGSKTDAVFYIVRGEAFLFSNQWKQKSSHGRRPKNQNSSYQVSLASQTPTDFESGRNDCNEWDGGTFLTKSLSPGGTHPPITPKKTNEISTVRCLLENSEN